MTQRTPLSATLDRLDGIQLARAIAALSVVIAHAIDHPLKGNAGEIFQLGARYGVTLFFVISGFIMTQTTGLHRFNAAQFLNRRVRRVVPIYWFATFLVASVTLIAPGMFQRTVFDPQHFFLSLFFIPAYDPSGTGGIWPMFKLGWTLNYEMFFYVSFAATFAFGLVTRAILLTLFFGTCILIGQMYHFDAAIPTFYTRIDTLAFVAGVWLGVLNLKGRFRSDNVTLVVLLMASTALLAWIASQYPIIRLIPWTQVGLIAVCAAHAAILVILVDKRGRMPHRLWLYIGDSSYSIYLFHMFAIGAVTAVIRRLPADLMIPMIGVSALCGCIAGMIAYQFIERPLIRHTRGRRPVVA